MSRPSTGAWIRLPLDLLKEEGLTKTDCVVLALIIDRCYEHPEQRCCISRSSLAQAADCSERQLRYSVDRLIKLGLIVRRITGRAAEYQLTGAVELLPPKRTPRAAAPVRSTRPRSGRPTPDEIAQADEYLSLVNRFRSEADDQLPGQQTFPVILEEDDEQWKE